MRFNPVGYSYGQNFNNGQHDEIVRRIVASNPRTTLIMDSGGLETRQLLEQLPAEAVLIYRSTRWRGEESDLWKNYSPGEILQRIEWEKDNGIPDGVWFNVSNEPVPGDNIKDAEDMADWHADVLNVVCERGHRVHIMQLGSGVVHLEHIMDGAYDRFLQVFYYWWEQGLARLGVHEYTAGDLPLAVGAKNSALPQEQLIMDFTVMPDQWLKRADIYERLTALHGRYPDFWHLGRLTWWFPLRMAEIGLIDSVFDLVDAIDITEFGNDRMGDLFRTERAWNGMTLDQHAERVTPPADHTRQYPEYRGHNSWMKFYDIKYATWGWTGQRAFYEMCRWAFDELYPPAVGGACIFQINYLGQNKSWPEPLEWGGVGFNIYLLKEFLDLNQAYEPGKWDDIVLGQEYKEVRVTSLWSTNVRMAPSINGLRVGSINNGDKVKLYKPETPDQSGADYVWNVIEVNDMLSFVSKAHWSWELVETAPSEKEQLVTELEQLRDSLTALIERVEEL
jgi:hypothetical protein